MSLFDGHLGDISRILEARSRSISPENFSGEKGKGGMATEGTGAYPARELGRGWKISPSIEIEPRDIFQLADIAGPAVIRSIWITVAPNVRLRDYIIRFYWDNQTQPSVETPLGDFFCLGWEDYAHIASIPVAVNPTKAFNCFWPMPFRKRARITLENRNPYKTGTVYYQINFDEMILSEDHAYFHAQFRRENPTQFRKDYTLLDGLKGSGHYVGTYMAWGVNSCGWWGEGEIKFFIDGDSEFPTICGTGTEDYFGGSYCFDIGELEPTRPNAYTEFTTPYLGMPQVIRPDGVYEAQQRFGLYRWHLPDPIRFERDLRVTIQALGWYREKTHDKRRYKPLRDDIASTVFWYQTLPTAPFPDLPDRDFLEV